MNGICLSLMGPLLAGALLVGSPLKAEVLVGLADTFSGPAGWGFQVQRSAELAADEVNEAGGVLGESVRIVWVDDSCDADQAVAAARKLVADGVVFALGHSCSHAAIAASKVYEEAGVLFFAPNATNPKLTDEGDPNVFRLRGRDDQAGLLAADYLVEHWGDKRIAVVHDGRIYGWFLAETVRQRLNDRGIKEAAYEEVTAGQLDFSSLITDLNAAAVDIVFFGGYPLEVGLFIRQAREQGSDFALVGGDALPDEEFALVAGEAAEGTIATNPPYPKDAEAAARLLARYHEKYPVQPGKPEIDMNFTSYEAFRVWAEAVEGVGTFNLDAVIEVLRGQKFDTLLGEIGFDDKGDLTGVDLWAFWIWENGQLVEKAPNELPPTD